MEIKQQQQQAVVKPPIPQNRVYSEESGDRIPATVPMGGGVTLVDHEGTSPHRQVQDLGYNNNYSDPHRFPTYLLHQPQPWDLTTPKPVHYNDLKMPVHGGCPPLPSFPGQQQGFEYMQEKPQQVAHHNVNFSADTAQRNPYLREGGLLLNFHNGLRREGMDVLLMSCFFWKGELGLLVSMHVCLYA